jgi:hypothetical protein
MNNITAAHYQWAHRPDDERYNTLNELLDKSTRIKNTCAERTVRLDQLQVNAVDDNGLEIITSDGGRAIPTNHAFTQLCRVVDYPVAGLVNKVPAPLAAEIVNHRIRVTERNTRNVLALLQHDDHITLRSITSQVYGRVYNADLIPFLFNAQEMGFRIPPARPAFANQKGSRLATENDVLANNAGMGLEVKIGDPIAPAGLYMGDRDMFAVMVDTVNKIEDDTGRPMSRGFFLRNDEVGSGSLQLTTFLMQCICGNHIIWDAQNIVTVRYKHIGEVYYRAMESMRTGMETLRSFTRPNLEIMSRLRTLNVGPDRDETVQNVYDLGIDGVITKKVLESAYDYASTYADDDGALPNTALGIVNGLTRYSQIGGFADERLKLDRAAGKILKYFATSL